jgi:hypothetical protein
MPERMLLLLLLFANGGQVVGGLHCAAMLRVQLQKQFLCSSTGSHLLVLCLHRMQHLLLLLLLCPGRYSS